MYNFLDTYDYGACNNKFVLKIFIRIWHITLKRKNRIRYDTYIGNKIHN